jgi:hypothetical protein
MRDAPLAVPRGLQRAGAEDFGFAQQFKGGGGDCGDGDRVAYGVENFD